MEYIGGASGAVLGYIHGNRRGAILGYQIGKKLARMPPYNTTTTPSRKRSVSVTSTPGRRQTRTPVKPRMTIKSRVGKKRTKTTEASAGLRAAKVKNRVKKGVTIKPKKKVKITKNFKLKVTKALSSKLAKGKYLEIVTDGTSFPLVLGNKQIRTRLGNDQGNAGSKLLFNPAHVLDSASVLFNNKVASRSSKWSVDGFGIYTFGDQSFDSRISKIHVLNSYASFVLRNNSNRTWIIQLYECAPKKDMSYILEQDVLQQWVNCMTNEANTGDLEGTTINLGDATPETLYATPQSNKRLLKDWKFERHDIILDPGQTYDHFIQGPSDVVYDFAKFWRNDNSGAANVFLDINKRFTRQVIMTARVDLAQNAENTTSRYGIPNGKGWLVWECKQYFNIEAPEHTPSLVTLPLPASGTINADRDNIRDCYFHKHWTETPNVAPTIRFELQTGTDNEL